MNKLGTFVFYAAMGATMMAGMRVMDWVIPKPASRVFVCIVVDGMETECKSLEEIQEKAAAIGEGMK